jgi:hypothetical protein
MDGLEGAWMHRRSRVVIRLQPDEVLAEGRGNRD